MILTLDQKNTLLSEDIIQTFIKELNKKYAEKSEESEKSGESSESEESEKSEESTSYSEQLKTWRKNKTKEKRDEEDLIFNRVKNEAFEFYETKFEYNISNHSNHSNEVISIINFELSTQGTKTVEQIIQTVKDYIDSMYSNREAETDLINDLQKRITEITSLITNIKRLKIIKDIKKIKNKNEQDKLKKLYNNKTQISKFK
jgi:hypothetical protein